MNQWLNALLLNDTPELEEDKPKGLHYAVVWSAVALTVRSLLR